MVPSGGLAGRHYSRQSCADCSARAHADALGGGMRHSGRPAVATLQREETEVKLSVRCILEPGTDGQGVLASQPQPSGRLRPGRTRREDQPQSFVCVCVHVRVLSWITS